MNRNEKCKCGSGRKYKHCCLIKERLQKEQRLAEARTLKKDTATRPPSAALTAMLTIAAQSWASAGKNFEGRRYGFGKRNTGLGPDSRPI